MAVAHQQDISDLLIPEKDGLLPSSSTTTSSPVADADRRDSMLDEKETLSQVQQKDEEGGVLPLQSQKPSIMAFWIFINITSTVSIIFINKRIFTSPAFNGAQFLFASYHFLLSYLILSLLSSPSNLLSSIRHFDRRHVSARAIFPLAASMSLNVVFLNTSLAFCSVVFYQVVRVLLTPVVAAIEYVFYKKSIPRQAAWCLLPTCAGVAWLAANESKASAKAGQTTGLFGAGFALTGVVVSSVYTVWIGTYQRKLEMSSTQLLHAQSPIGAVMLAVLGVVSGKIPAFADFDTRLWQTMALSGICACLINLSQFRIVGSAGAVAGTVVGHVKTIIIVLLGWFISGKSISDGSVYAVSVAVAGVVAYTWADLRYRKK